MVLLHGPASDNLTFQIDGSHLVYSRVHGQLSDCKVLKSCGFKTSYCYLITLLSCSTENTFCWELFLTNHVCSVF